MSSHPKQPQSELNFKWRLIVQSLVLFDASLDRLCIGYYQDVCCRCPLTRVCGMHALSGSLFEYTVPTLIVRPLVGLEHCDWIFNCQPETIGIYDLKVNFNGRDGPICCIFGCRGSFWSIYWQKSHTASTLLHLGFSYRHALSQWDAYSHMTRDAESIMHHFCRIRKFI